MNGAARLILRRSDQQAPADEPARINLNMTVGDLDTIRERVIKAGGRVRSEPLDSAVGPYLKIEDPFGNSIHIIDHPWDDIEGDAIPAMFNIGLQVRDIPRTEAFLTGLGFKVSTREYLPKTLVFERTGAGGYLVVHAHAERQARSDEATGSLVIRTPEGRAGQREVRGPSGILVRMVAASSEPNDVAVRGAR